MNRLIAILVGLVFVLGTVAPTFAAPKKAKGKKYDYRYHAPKSYKVKKAKKHKTSTKNVPRTQH